MSTEYTYQVSDSSTPVNTLISSYDKATDKTSFQLGSGSGSPVTISLARSDLQDLSRFLGLVLSFPGVTPSNFR